MEDIFEAALADDPSRIAAIVAETPGAAAQRMDDGLFVTEVTHLLYPGDTPLHLAAAGLRHDAARALLSAGTPVNAVNRRGATALHYACDPRPSSPTWDPPAARASSIAVRPASRTSRFLAWATLARPSSAPRRSIAS